MAWHKEGLHSLIAYCERENTDYIKLSVKYNIYMQTCFDTRKERIKTSLFVVKAESWEMDFLFKKHV